MKKLILLCMVFVFSNTFYAQTAAEKKAKETTAKAKEVKKKADAAKKEAQAAPKLKKDGTPDKRFKENEKATKLKKDGTPDKRYKDNAAPAAKAKVKKMTAAEEKEDMKETAVSKSAEKKVKDKATGTYKGKKVYTGPRGGKYYINKNGNKTYIDRD